MTWHGMLCSFDAIRGGRYNRIVLLSVAFWAIAKLSLCAAIQLLCTTGNMMRCASAREGRDFRPLPRKDAQAAGRRKLVSHGHGGITFLSECNTPRRSGSDIGQITASCSLGPAAQDNPAATRRPASKSDDQMGTGNKLGELDPLIGSFRK